MPKLNVITQAGDEVTIEDLPGRTVMELMRDHGIPDLLALCGGSCSCATCHVWVDPAFVARLPPVSSEEDALLECSSFRKETSRLSCQLTLTDDLDGLRVTLAPED